MRVLVVNHVTLDGVLQGPGRPDEDTRNGFRHGGWAEHAAQDPAIGPALRARMGPDFSWLFGRRSYEDMLAHWNKVGGPYKDGLNGILKYVASSQPDTELPWPNSRLLSGDVPAAIGALREQPGGNLVIMGSGQLIRSLLPHGLVDELFLMIHPIILGSGQRLFDQHHDEISLSLVHTASTPDRLDHGDVPPLDGQLTTGSRLNRKRPSTQAEARTYAASPNRAAIRGGRCRRRWRGEIVSSCD